MIGGLLILAGAAFLLGGDAPRGGRDPLEPTTLVRIDLETGQRSRLSVGDSVTALTLGEGSVWLASLGDSSLYRLDPRTMSVQSQISLPEPPQEVAAGADAIWVTTVRKLIRIDPSSDKVAQVFPIGPCEATEECQTDVTVGQGAVWASHYDSQRLVEVDPSRNTVVHVTNLRSFPMALAAGHGGLWVLLDAASPTIDRIDLASRKVSSETLPGSFISPACVGYGRTPPAGELCVALGVGDRSVWVGTPGDVHSDLWQLDPTTGDRIGSSISVPCCVMAITPSSELVPKIWAGLSGGDLIVVTEASAHAEERGSVRGVVTDVAIGYGGVWVSVDDRGPEAD